MTFVLLLILSYSHGQKLSSESAKWKTDNVNRANVEKEELMSNFNSFDLSHIWLKNQDENFGFIGAKYHKFDVLFLDIKKEKFSYFVEGKARFSNLVYKFHGTVKVLNVRKLNYHKELLVATNSKDEEYIEIFKLNRYMIISEINICSINKGIGDICGIMVSYVYERNRQIFYDDLEFVSDGYSNNLFVGEWRNFMLAPKNKYRCCWGNYKIPNSGDLNVGIVDFCPNTKYLKYGWKSYYDALKTGDSSAINKVLNW